MSEPVPRELRLTPASDITPKRVRWLWEPRVPLGKLTILAGPAGQGKSQLTCALAAWTSMGVTPGDLRRTKSDVLIVSAEDDPDDTIIPRLIAAGAYRERVHIVDAREFIHGTPYPASVALPGDVPAIHHHVQETGARLVILDPVTGLLDDQHSAVSNQEVRRALSPLKEMAQATGAAVVCVMHPNKGSSTNALARIADSGAFTALARSVLLMGPDPADDDGDRGSSKVLALPKSNLAGRGEYSLSLTIEGDIVDGQDGPIPTSRVVVNGSSTATAADLLQTGNDDDGSALSEARAFLRAELRDGPRPASEVKNASKQADIAERTLRRARELMCEVTKEHGPTGKWLWALKVTKSTDHRHLGHHGHLPDCIGDFTNHQDDQLDQDVQGGQGGNGRRGGHLGRNGHLDVTGPAHVDAYSSLDAREET